MLKVIYHYIMLIQRTLNVINTLTKQVQQLEVLWTVVIQIIFILSMAFGAKVKDESSPTGFKILK